MRIRFIKPEFYRDEITGVMSAEVALFYLALCSYCDDLGRFEWNAVLIRADVDPYDAKFGGLAGIERLLASLETLGRIKRYAVGGKNFGAMPSFGKHQKPKYPTPSRIPEPPPFIEEPSVTPPPILPQSSPERSAGYGYGLGIEKGNNPCAEPPAATPAPASPQQTVLTPEAGGGETPASQPKASPPPPTDDSPVVAEMPCVKGQTYRVTEAKVREWQDAYPGVDVLREVKGLVQWARDNPSRRKTLRGASGFFSRNLARKQDSGRGQRTGGGPKPLPPEWQRAMDEADAYASGKLAVLAPKPAPVAPSPPLPPDESDPFRKETRRLIGDLLRKPAPEAP